MKWHLILAVSLLLGGCATTSDHRSTERSVEAKEFKSQRRPASVAVTKADHEFKLKCENVKAQFKQQACFCPTSKEFINPFVNACE